MEAAKAADAVFNASLKQAGGRSGFSVGGGISLKSSSSGSSNMTSEFLKKWGDINNSVLSTLNGAIDDMKNGKATFPGSEQLNTLMADIGKQSEEYQAKYGGLETAALDQARSDMAARGELQSQYMDLAKADYAGETGRAAADVRASSERAMGAEMRQAMSYGEDPTSGKFGALGRKSYLDQARNEVMAMSDARRNEKERVTNMTAQGMQLIDPSKSYSMASDIAGQKANFTHQQANLQLASTNAGMQAKQLTADLAGRVADIGSQYGSVGMAMLGTEQGGGGTSSGSGGGGMVNYGKKAGGLVSGIQLPWMKEKAKQNAEAAG